MIEAAANLNAKPTDEGLSRLLEKLGSVDRLEHSVLGSKSRRQGSGYKKAGSLIVSLLSTFGRVKALAVRRQL